MGSSEYIKGEQPAILRKDGTPYKPIKERPPAEIKHVTLANRALVVIRETDPKKRLSKHKIALMVNAIRDSHPDWCGSVLCLEPHQGFEKMPEPIARKMHRILDNIFGGRAPLFKDLDRAVHELTPDWMAGCPPEMAKVLAAACALVGELEVLPEPEDVTQDGGPAGALDDPSVEGEADGG